MSDEDLFGQSAGASSANGPARSAVGAVAPSGPGAPLAARFRPRALEEFVGQEHLLGEGKPLRRLIESDRLSSLILFGPPGVGKTSLAEVIANRTECRFERLNAVDSSVGELRKVLGAAAIHQRNSGARTLLFIDEIHRFNKSQQDALLPDVEAGTVRLIGATTHNPSFYVNGPLVSRSQIFALEPLDDDDLRSLVTRALADTERGLGSYRATLEDAALDHLIATSEGDARRVLNGLELAVATTPPTPAAADGNPDAPPTIRVTLRDMEECVQKKRVLYDRDEDQHYDTISCFIKSVRGSSPDAAVYWLAKMIEAGEDPRFICRRLIILASEDIGMADPRGLMIATAAAEAVERIGMPEGRIILSHATVYLATAPKSNASYQAIGAAQKAVREGKAVPVPKPFRDAHYKGAKGLGHGAGYLYDHDFPGGVAPQEFGIEPGRFYQPTNRGYEKTVRERLDVIAELRQRHVEASDDSS